MHAYAVLDTRTVGRCWHVQLNIYSINLAHMRQEVYRKRCDKKHEQPRLWLLLGE